MFQLAGTTALANTFTTPAPEDQLQRVALALRTPVAAVCLAALMVFAFVFHIARHEMPNIAFNAVLGILAAFVAYGRIVVVPF